MNPEIFDLIDTNSAGILSLIFEGELIIIPVFYIFDKGEFLVLSGEIESDRYIRSVLNPSYSSLVIVDHRNKSNVLQMQGIIIGSLPEAKFDEILAKFAKISPDLKKYLDLKLKFFINYPMSGIIKFIPSRITSWQGNYPTGEFEHYAIE
ncbi:MAG: hypothetical protein IH840_02100, partial [Candidatus Heimdallarchaeota archaeon]|nr:hypothetical protein [Candidatus Heimdallarchaeota archaeon]